MTAAVIVTAGRTDRKNSFSPERQLGKISALERIVALFQLAGISRIVVVGDEKELAQKLVASMNVVFLTVPSDAEMLDSVKEGLRYLQGKCTQAFVAHVDIPLFTRQTLASLLDGTEEVCIPTCGGRCGHPILLRSSCFEAVCSYCGTNGLKGAIQALGLGRQLVQTQDAGILAEGTQGTDYSDLLPGHDVAQLHAGFQIRISREKVFYGPGPHHLLQLTDEFGSLSNACQHMGMSYTKGRRIISTMEEELGFPVLETQQGGKTGGSSRLTQSALSLMARYCDFEAEAAQMLEELFQKYFS